LERNRDDLHDQGVRITFSGREDRRIPKRVLRDMRGAEELTLKNKVMTLNIAFNYGGRAEIVDAVRRLVKEKVPESKIDEKAIRRRLYHPELADPDLVIRTSGEYRISNFLLWEIAYSELVFSEVLWPDFRREDLFEAIEEFQRRERRFGGVDQ
jgi:undecaprenyl diphosphate synthase